MRKAVLVVGVLTVLALSAFSVRAYLLHRYGASHLNVGSQLVLGWFGLGAAAKPAPDPDLTLGDLPPPREIEVDPRFAPFREIGNTLGKRASGNNVVITRGAAIFDANGDGRLDLYLPHSGRPVAKVTEDNVLLEERAPAKASVLYLNQGNDENGDPVFRSVQDLTAAGNTTHVREELLIENKYRPRNSLDDDELAPGRIGYGAIAADFNGDGRQDLYVVNFHYGLIAQTAELAFRVYPAQENLGRRARKSRDHISLRFPSFLHGPIADGLHETVDLGDEPEPEGRNSLYLNLGDQDGDGLPEWRDATDEAGVGGHHASASAAVADYDRDGDLDLYVANFLDPDYWGFGTTRFAGNRNQLYKNLLAETGELRFRDVAGELRVAGLHDEEGLGTGSFLPDTGANVEVSEHVVGGRRVGEKADHSWAAVFHDFNRDEWLDLIVANDVSNRLRIYENLKGRGFRRLEELDESHWDGCWMGMSVGDLDGDLHEDVFITNCGSQTMSVRNTALFIEHENEANMQALAVLNYPRGKTTLHHVILRHTPELGFEQLATEVRVHHSPFMPPDLSVAANFAPQHLDFFERNRFADSLTAYEFAWNGPMLDVDNDGDLDLYLAGSLARGNDGFIGDWSGSPGRLLVNESRPGSFEFRDRTLEYRLLDMQHVDYEANPPRRPAPGTGWHKRDYVYLTDTDAYSGMGLGASKSATRDFFRMHEAANAVLAADVNGDGFEDLLVTHTGGYNSLSPEARNMKVSFGGRLLSVPAPNKVVKPPTGFEEGPTFLYINGGAPAGREGRWVRLRLLNPGSHNRFGVGARVLVNGRRTRRLHVGAGSAFGAVSSDLHLGLGGSSLESLDVVWPDGDLSPEHIDLDPPVHNQTVCIQRGAGEVPCGVAIGAGEPTG